MLKYVGVCSILFLCTVTRAEWKVIKNIYEVDTKDPKQITISLGYFPEIVRTLVPRELTSTSKMVVNHLFGHIYVAKWENDLNCQVPDPSTIPTVNGLDVSAGLYFMSEPDVHHGEEIRTGFLQPCLGTLNFYTNIKPRSF